MNVLGLYGSPRKGGNSDVLLDAFLDGARSAGGEVIRIYARDLDIGGCLECGGCDHTGSCVVEDGMQSVYPLLEEATVVAVSAPVFFYGVPAQLKALIDRAQALWAKRRLTKTAEERKRFHGGHGYLLSVGATRGKQLFDGVVLTAKYFFDALDMAYEGGLFFPGVEAKGAISDTPDAVERARELGKQAVRRAHRGEDNGGNPE